MSEQLLASALDPTNKLTQNIHVRSIIGNSFNLLLFDE